MFRNQQKSMEYKEEVLESKSIILLAIKGHFTFHEIAKLGLKYRRIALEKKYRLVCDFSEAKGQVTVSDIQTYFSNYIHPVDKRLSEVPVAYITNESDYAAFKLMQQIWDNQGVSIVVFKEVQSGIKWFETNQ